MSKQFILLATLAMFLFGCETPIPIGKPSEKGLRISWSIGEKSNSRTIMPSIYPTPSTYDITLHPSDSSGEISKTDLTASSWSTQDVGAKSYTITVIGKNSQGGVLVTGSSSIDLTTSAEQSVNISLNYVTSGSGTGQMHIIADMSGVTGETVTSLTLKVADPSNSVTTPAMSGNSYENLSATVGSYKVFVIAKSTNKTAIKAESVLVVQNVDTIATIFFSNSDFAANYVAVTSLSLNKTSSSLTKDQTEQLTTTLNAGASNTLTTWESDAPTIAEVDQNGLVTAKSAGTAHIKATSVDNTSKSDTCEYTISNPVVTTYKVSFNTNGGSAIADITGITSGSKITKPSTDPTKTGNSFVNWYKDSGFTDDWDFDVDTVTSDTVLWAKWQLNNYTVTFNSQGGSSVTSATVSYGGKVTKPANPTKSGKDFGEWFKESSCTNAWNFNVDTITGDTTLWAKWTDTPTSIIKIAVDNNGLWIMLKDNKIYKASSMNGGSWIATPANGPSGVTMKGITANSIGHWIVHDGSKIYISADKGTNWTAGVNGPSGVTIIGLATNTSDYLMVNDSSKIYISANNGTNWTAGVNGPSSVTMKGLDVNSIGHWVVYDESRIYISANTGTVWNSGTETKSGVTMQGIAIDSNDYWLINDLTKVYLSTNLGSSWASEITLPN